MAAYRDPLLAQASNVVKMFANGDFLHTGLTFLEYHEFSWPHTISAELFYKFATMLIPSWKWDNQIRSSSLMRYMQRDLHQYLELEKSHVEEDDIDILENIICMFNACGDIIEEEEGKLTSMMTDGTQIGINKQHALQEAATSEYHSGFKFNVRSPLQIVRMIDEFADTWRAQKEAEMDTQAAMQNTTDQLRLDSAPVMRL